MVISLDRLQEMYDTVHKKKNVKCNEDRNMMENAIGKSSSEMSTNFEAKKNFESDSKNYNFLKYLLLFLLPLPPIYARTRCSKKMSIKK